MYIDVLFVNTVLRTTGELLSVQAFAGDPR